MENTNDLNQFLESYYIKEKYEKIGNRWELVHPDALILVYKLNGKKELKVIENPKYTFRVSKTKLPHNMDSISNDDSIPVTCLYRDRYKAMAEALGMYDEYKNFMSQQGNNKQMFFKRLELNPNVFGSDIDIEDYFKIQFYMKYGIKIGEYDKIFTDIEADMKRGGSTNYMKAECPINVVSLYRMNTNTMYVLILDEPDVYTQLPDFKNNIETFKNIDVQNEIQRIKSVCLQTDKDKIYADRLPDRINIEIYFYKTELELIINYFKLMKSFKADFNMSWNFSFDSMTLINRLKKYEDQLNKMNLTVEDIICHEDVPKQYRKWYFKEETKKSKKDTKGYYERWHELSIPGYTKWLCSMSLYVNLRKSEGKEPNYKLQYIAEKELGVGKLDYSDTGANIVTFPYVDYKRFILYNIVDTYIMSVLEFKNRDIDKLMLTAATCKLDKAVRQTLVLRNSRYVFYLKRNRMIGNNINSIYSSYNLDDSSTYMGAIVANPANNRYFHSSIYDFLTNTIFSYVIDNDLKSMYPSITVSSNIFKTTLYFHVTSLGNINGLVKDTYAENEENYLEDCFSNYHTGDIIRFGTDYLNLPSLEDFINNILEITNKKEGN